MVDRIKLGLLTLSAILGLTVAVHQSWWVYVALILIFGVASLYRVSAALRLIALALMTAGLLVWSPYLSTGVLALLTIGEGIMAGRQRPTTPDNALLVAFIISAIASLIDPGAAWSLIAVVVLGLYTLITAGRTAPAWARERTQLGWMMGGISAGVALVAGGLLWILPWRFLVDGLFYVVAYPLAQLLRLVHPMTPRPRIRRRSTLGHIGRPHHHPVPHHGANMVLSGIGILLGLMILTIIVYAVYRYLRRPDDAPTDDDEAYILRETLTGAVPNPWTRPIRLTPVRDLVRRRLRQGRRRGHPRETYETLREWMARTETTTTSDAPRLYEEIRYGNRPDTLEAKATMEHLWPDGKR